MTKRAPRKPHGPPPPQRAASSPPAHPGVRPVPRGDPMSQPPVPEVTRAPRARGVGKVPNPRKPRLVRDVHGNELMDLFAVFPDLPRPVRPTPRVPLRARARRLRRATSSRRHA